MSFRRKEKTSREHKSENQEFQLNSRFRRDMGFLIADSDSTQKVTSIATFLTQKYVFGGCNEPIHVFRQNHVFADGEQQTRLCELLAPDSENSGSKVPGVGWNSVFFRNSQYTM